MLPKFCNETQTKNKRIYNVLNAVAVNYVVSSLSLARRRIQVKILIAAQQEPVLCHKRLKKK